MGVALGLVAFLAADPFAWRNNQTNEPRKWPDLSEIDDTRRTTYYYDDEDTRSTPGIGNDDEESPPR